jgi:hypothetical protein
MVVAPWRLQPLAEGRAQMGPYGLTAGPAGSGRTGCGLGQAGLRHAKQQRTCGKDEGASADFRDLGRNRLWAEKERRKEIPFYFQKAFSWKTK